jgi:hypothetical protein
MQMSIYFYFYVDLYGSGDWHFHMTERPPTPQAVRSSYASPILLPNSHLLIALQADEELFLVAMEHQIAEHKVLPLGCSWFLVSTAQS